MSGRRRGGEERPRREASVRRSGRARCGRRWRRRWWDMERKEAGVWRKRPGGEARRRRRKRESSGSGGRESGLLCRRERKWAEVKAGRRRRSGAGAMAGSGAGWRGRVSATSEAATMRGSASAVDGE
jgi:hypothetical protein